MKRKFLAGVSILAAAAIMASKTASAGISGSAHDFQSTSWNTSKEICIVCHTPHKAQNDSTSKIAPLWNHTLSIAEYTVYSSPSLKASVGQPSAASKICLSCHDGTVALGAFGGNESSSKIKMSQTPWTLWNLGTDLSEDHPVSFTYNTDLATADGGLRDPASKTVAALGNKTVKDGMLIGDKVECSSCHDVHADKGDSKNEGNHLLLVSNTGSALCLTCHNK